MPKEMLPVVDKPVIQYVVEEAVASGIEDIIIVTGYSKRNIEDHFDNPSQELVNNLISGGKERFIEDLNKIANLANFIYVRQKGPYGNGTPVLNARHIIGDEPFAVLWGDQFTWSSVPRLRQCLEVYQKYGDPVLSAVRLNRPEDAQRYGIFDVEPTAESSVFKMKGIVEKPEPAKAPSDLLADGGYILTPDIFDELETVGPRRGNEIWLADAIDQLSKKRQFYVREVQDGAYYDTGSKLEYVKTVVDFALMHEDLKGDFEKFLRDKMTQTK